MNQRATLSESARADQELAATLVRVVCLAMLLIISTSLMRAIIYPASAADQLTVAGGVGFAVLVAHFLSKSGRPQLAGVALVALAFVVLAYSAANSEGVRSPAYIGLLSLSFFSVWLVGLAGGIIVVTAAMGLGYALLQAEGAGLLAGAVTTVTNDQFWQSILIQMVLAVLLQWAMLRQVRLSARARLQSEVRYRALFHSAADAIVVADATTGMLVDANPQACALVGRSLGELRGLHMSELHPPEQQELVRASLERAQQHQGGVDGSFLVLHTAGHRIPVEIATSTLLTANGERHLLGIFRDVSERQHADAELRASEERFRVTFEQAAVGMCQADLLGRLLRSNSRLGEITGYSCDELLAMTLADLVYPDDRANDVALREQLLAGVIATYALEMRYLRRDETIIWVNLTVSPVRGPGGAIIQLQAVVEEITDRKLSEWALRQLNATLEERVAQRTVAHSAANERLQTEVAVRRQVELALRESEARFRRMAENAPDIMYRFEYKPTARFVYVSASFETITGYTPAECYADPMFGSRLMHADDMPLLHRILADPESLRGPVEMRWLHRDGSVVWIEQRNVPLLDDTGALVAIEGIARDITARKRSLEALRESDLRYRDLLTNLRQGVVVLQEERIVFCNDALAVILGTTVERLLVSSVDELFDQVYVHDRARLMETIGATISTGSILSDMPFRFYRSDNQAVRWIHTASSLITYEGRPSILSVLSDITELKNTEDRLRQSEARLRMLLDNTPAVIFTSRAEGEYGVTFISESLRKVLGYEPEAFVGESGFWATHVHPDDVAQIFAAMPLLFVQGWHQHEYRFRHADGSYRWIESGLTLAHLGDTMSEIVGYMIDITPRKEAEEVLRQSRDTLRTANLELGRAARLKDEFLANMSHELRTPLNNVLGRAELLVEEIHGPLNEKQQRSVESIQESGRHLLELINDILDLSKIEADKLDLQQEPVSVCDLCEASIRLVSEAAQKKTILIAADVDPDVVLIRGDPRRLKQILVNLLSNAVKFTPRGGHVGLEVRGDREGGIVTFTIWDTGIGIEKADIPRLFRPFEQLDSRLSRQYEGTGLGLSLVSRLTRLHGGGVSVTSVPGHGSRFTVTLPWRPRDE